ncbi:hypothetical protein BJX64DRAFT_278233 [Aspergillus heterothallicus]
MSAVLKAHIDHLFAAGIHGLVPGGSTGEFITLTVPERKKLIKSVIKHTAGRGPVVAGAESTKTEEDVELAKHAAQAGAAALMVVPPYYDPPNYEQLHEFMDEVHNASGLPIVYYNIPAASGITLTPSQIADMSAVGVRWFIDTSGNAPDLTELMFAEGHRAKVSPMNGWGGLTFYGIVAGNEACLWEALAEKNDLRKGRELWAKIWSICKFLEGGQATGGLRKPFALLGQKERDEFKALLEKAGVTTV